MILFCPTEAALSQAANSLTTLTQRCPWRRNGMENSPKNYEFAKVSKIDWWLFDYPLKRYSNSLDQITSLHCTFKTTQFICYFSFKLLKKFLKIKVKSGQREFTGIAQSHENYSIFKYLH